MVYRREALRFQCTGCGSCCIGDGTVAVTDGEAERIRAFLGVSRAWFRRRYLVRLSGSGRGIRLGEDGRCSFLGRNGRCRVYPVRPVQCRTYPFWPELVASRRAWLEEGRFCEGIGRGPAVPAARIQALLRSALRARSPDPAGGSSP